MSIQLYCGHGKLEGFIPVGLCFFRAKLVGGESQWMGRVCQKVLEM